MILCILSQLNCIVELVQCSYQKSLKSLILIKNILEDYFRHLIHSRESQPIPKTIELYEYFTSFPSTPEVYDDIKIIPDIIRDFSDVGLSLHNLVCLVI